MRLLNSLGLAVFLGALLSSCSSSSDPDDSTARFKAADTNGDGVLSREEISDAVVRRIFAGRDANGDGMLTREEWWPGEDAEQAAMFDKLDLNGDGFVTLEEALTYGRRSEASADLLKEADADGDGVVSWEEALNYYGQREG